MFLKTQQNYSRNVAIYLLWVNSYIFVQICSENNWFSFSPELTCTAVPAGPFSRLVLRSVSALVLLPPSRWLHPSSSDAPGNLVCSIRRGNVSYFISLFSCQSAIRAPADEPTLSLVS